MKIKRYFAPDMRNAIRLVREEQGPDAVILSNKSVKGGVEVVAAVDYDESLFQFNASAELKEPAAPSKAQVRVPATPAPAPPTRPASVAKPSGAVNHTANSQRNINTTRPSEIVWSQDPTLVEMRAELKELRGLLENQVSHIAWNDFSGKQPLRADLLRYLTSLGLAPGLSRVIADRVEPQSTREQTNHKALSIVQRHLSVCNDDILVDGGVVALVGATGVGKTTSVAKLAARFALRHGHRHVALITTDSYRIGAQEQLLTFGRILGVPVHVATSHSELETMLKSVADKKLVLIDTAGMSQRDLRLSEQFSTLNFASSARTISTYLVVSANTQANSLDEVCGSFSQTHLSGCIVTKTDEASSLGGILSVSIKHKLPIAYISDGQRVPEDIHPARAEKLVRKAVELSQQTKATMGEESMAMAFGGAVAHAYV